jgi:tetratricopeptide (TPR) repeat protein
VRAEYLHGGGVLSGMSRLAEDGFARAALLSGCCFSAGLAEARALMSTGRPEQAELLLATLVPPSPAGAIKLAVLRAGNLFWALDRPAEACALLDGAPELIAIRARFAFAQGDPRAALALAAPIEAAADAPPAARVAAAVALAEAFAVCGRRDEAVAVAKRWEPESERRFARAQAMAHWLVGSLLEATADAERAYAVARHPHAVAMAALQLGHVWLSRGDLECALRWFRESSALWRSADPARMRPAALAGIAQVAAQAGDAAHARAAVAQIDDPRGRGVGEEIGLAHAWTAHVCGDHAEAIRIATDVVATAEARGADGCAARARGELARLAAH